MQQSLNGIPSPEISHIFNFMLTYMEPWYSVTQDLSLFLPRFHLYANAIVGRGSCIGAGGINCRVVGFTTVRSFKHADRTAMATSSNKSTISSNSTGKANDMDTNSWGYNFLMG